MNPNPPQPKRRQINGQWYQENAQGGWAPIHSSTLPAANRPIATPATAPIANETAPGVVTSPDDVVVEPTYQATPNVSVAAPAEAATPATPVDKATEQPAEQKPKKRKKLLLTILLVLAALLIAAAAVGAWWYQSALQPVSQSEDKVRVTIESGSSPATIGELLHKNELIHSTLAFDIYTRLTDNRGNLQMGTYTLSPSQSMSEIVDHLTSGKVDTYALTLFSGEALLPPVGSERSNGKDVQSVLLKAGFSKEQVDAALAATYTSPLLAGRPSGSTLEGYIFPDTYTVDSSMSAEQFIQQTLRTYEQVVERHDLKAKYEAQGLTLHEGITLASIIEKEMGRYTDDMAQVAQVFYTRLADGMPLGSDVTAYYGADRIGEPRAVTVDTPYNTRMHPGMPPGPIGMPSEAALVAAANPAQGDYVYFLSGDDGKNYFAHTNEEHERNIVDHCKIGCAIP